MPKIASGNRVNYGFQQKLYVLILLIMWYHKCDIVLINVCIMDNKQPPFHGVFTTFVTTAAVGGGMASSPKLKTMRACWWWGKCTHHKECSYDLEQWIFNKHLKFSTFPSGVYSVGWTWGQQVKARRSLDDDARSGWLMANNANNGGWMKGDEIFTNCMPLLGSSFCSATFGEISYWCTAVLFSDSLYPVLVAADLLVEVLCWHN